ncbi:hypothetical protein [Luteibacter sahnii]|uniref:hypothetical protein n=1 Tax=Luteibacter sahnii TaxID=3021977 RepID=UPI002A757377|nr:hypothetical protein [Luteibacter sp. PPL193]MDY1550149.1 hypothetical protein [Luteibacter sp. PPL193]
MTSNHIPSLAEWLVMDDLERAVWAASFAASIGTQAVDVAVTYADRNVRVLRQADPTRNAVEDPALRAARAGIILERDEFDVWYQVERRMQTKWLRGESVITGKDLEDAFIRYSMGRSDYF